jgi:hypothetical protein
MEQAPPPPLAPPLPLSELRATAEALIDDMTKHPSWSASQRLRHAVRTHEAFTTAYPRLIDMCLNVRTFSDARDVRGILDMMLNEMGKIETSTGTFDDASVAVGKTLGARFLPNQPSASPE